tara:strand:- start:41 stop:271 length:231 start_codon:yes stop_codon:yes gene_type:complete
MLDKLRTLYQKAQCDEFEELDIFQTIDRIQEIANEVSLTDLVNLSSRQMGLIAELLWRVKRIKISPVDQNDFMGQA